MNLSVYIARRYLFSKKKHNAINIISGISTCGVALATLAMVCTLSVFNGFSDMVATFFTTFDPELKIIPREGKVFDAGNEHIQSLKQFSEVAVFSETLEEHAMVQYKGRQTMVVIKGVEDNFNELTQIDSILYGNGEFKLHDSEVNYGVLGVELISMLGTGLQFIDPLEVYAPKRNAPVNMSNPLASFNKEYLFSPGCVFAVNQQKYDAQYILTSLNFARTLYDYTTEASAIELKLKEGVSVKDAKKKIAECVGDDFLVKDRYEQQIDTFRIMEVEKLVSYVFLVFILLLACFNIIGSLSMLILDKKEDVQTLRSLGADNSLIQRIFLFEGWMISFFGAFIGILIGLLLCFIQQTYGVISLGSSVGSFLIDAYPVSVQLTDVLLIFFTVVVVGFVSVWYPVRYLSNRITRSVANFAPN
ncbi:ABC transporter permease [Bacteroides sp. 214]|uniref:FtsX-like permease family protein n=1 Tax=Bacteroides sp. 214 TaxID=2302935 RepID=UPI0013D2868C|nr:ABC transporter permease [Bacteroides sp. 214]